MSVSAISSNSIASAMGGTGPNAVQAEIAAAILKQIQDQQEQQAQALLRMIQGAPTLDGTGQIINVAA